MLSFLQKYFLSKVKNIPATTHTKEYLVSTFSTPLNNEILNKSLTLEYSKAKFANDFKTFQETADYILVIGSIFPESLNGASKEYYHSIARVSYYRCYLIINKQWKLFEELSDRLPEIINCLQGEINKKEVDSKIILP